MNIQQKEFSVRFGDCKRLGERLGKVKAFVEYETAKFAKKNKVGFMCVRVRLKDGQKGLCTMNVGQARYVISAHEETDSHVCRRCMDAKTCSLSPYFCE